MPLPEPEKGESKSEWMTRCMGDETMKRDFPEQDQRLAVCLRRWDEKDGESNMRSWYEIRNEADAEVAEVLIYDEIGWYGVTAKDFVEELKGVTAPAINLRINSPGGDVFDGVAIYNALRDHPATVNVTVDGLAASSASFIAQAGDRITMAKGATMMIHDPYAMAIGTAADMEKTAEVLNKIGDTIAGFYAARADGSEADWRAKMREESWYRDQEAVDAGLADAVAGKKASASNRTPLAVFNLASRLDDERSVAHTFKHVPAWLKGRPSSGRPDGARAGSGSVPRAAGRKMSQANLDQLHTAMENMDALHGSTCDMGGDCPMGGDGMSDHARPPRDAEWDTEYVNDLPDSAFAIVLPGGEKDDEGKTTPRSLRKLPHHNAAGAVDEAHLRNALSREPQTTMTEEQHAEARSHLDKHAEAEGIGEGSDKLDAAAVVAAINEGLKEAREEILR